MSDSQDNVVFAKPGDPPSDNARKPRLPNSTPGLLRVNSNSSIGTGGSDTDASTSAAESTKKTTKGRKPNTRSTKKTSGKTKPKPKIKDNASVQDQPEAEVEDSWVCKICEVEIRDDNAKVMSCERCHTLFCCNCLGMNSSSNDLMNSRPDIHWFCIDCERQAMLAVKGDWEIEERCAKYLESMNQRFVKIEESLELKVDKAAHDSLATKVESLNTQLNGLCTDIIDLDKKFDLLHKEPQDLEKRKNNLIIRGLPENSDVDDDQLVREVFFAISVADVPQPADVSRLGKKCDDDKGRPVGVVMSNEKAKWNATKRGPSLRSVNSDDFTFDPKNVFVVPDQTLLQRQEDVKLRESLRLNRSTDPNWKIRRGRLVRIKDEKEGELLTRQEKEA